MHKNLLKNTSGKVQIIPKIYCDFMWVMTCVYLVMLAITGANRFNSELE